MTTIDLSAARPYQFTEVLAGCGHKVKVSGRPRKWKIPRCPMCTGEAFYYENAARRPVAKYAMPRRVILVKE